MVRTAAKVQVDWGMVAKEVEEAERDIILKLILIRDREDQVRDDASAEKEFADRIKASNSRINDAMYSYSIAARREAIDAGVAERRRMRPRRDDGDDCGERMHARR